ncbi:mercury resistance system periplasmic binding protein MerP [Methyloglobulus sp.]|uniref:mercury resistance system periplasmic binding protein MerP n=1 Tax=Methyloglobulus sp. TaxID=2518622 RepID=UPI0032B8338C
MKKPFAPLLILTIFMVSNVMAANQSVMLEVQNMTCSVCPLTVKKALNKVDGVQQVEIDYDSKIATVTFDDAVTTTAKLTEATTNAGYPSTVKKP